MDLAHPNSALNLNLKIRLEETIMADMIGFSWPLTGGPGDTIEFFASTSSPQYSVTYVSFKNVNPAIVDDNTISNGGEIQEWAMFDGLTFTVNTVPQNLGHTPAEGASDWSASFPLTLTPGLASGVYAAKCRDGDGAVFYIPFIVKPAPDSRRDLLVLVNTNTWNAYNPEFGYSRYAGTPPDPVVLSFLRPNRTIFNPSLPDSTPTCAGPPFGLTSKDHLRGELWLLNWLAANGFPADTYTDLDLHVGIAFHEEYSAMLISTHPEYWSRAMEANLASYLNGGGTLLYLGGNGMFDMVDISDDMTAMTVWGTPLNRPRTFNWLGLPAAVFGIGTPVFDQGDGTVKSIGDNYPERATYKVSTPDPGEILHPFFIGTGLLPGDEFGARGWFLAYDPNWTIPPIAPIATIDNSGASGGECDRRDVTSPSNLQVLAVGTNTGKFGNADSPPPYAEMTYYDHPGGGFVFSTGSISFVGSLIIDSQIQTIVSNALNHARARGNLLFYNASMGVGATAVLNRAGTYKSVSQISGFDTGWTHITGTPSGGVLFYNAGTGEGATAVLDGAGNYRFVGAIDGFDTEWTHIGSAGQNGLLFYNALTGVGATALLNGAGQYVYVGGITGFDTGWTHVTGTPSGRVLFYNASTGVGASAAVNSGGDYAFLGAIDGFDTGWTHIVSASLSGLLFYNAATGVGATAVFDGAGEYAFVAQLTGFDAGWTHVSGTPRGGLLFYDSSTGVSATATLDLFGNYLFTGDVPGIDPGWTLIVPR
jgi:hypothetical protein